MQFHFRGSVFAYFSCHLWSRFQIRCSFPVFAFPLTSLLASTINIDGTNILREPRGLGKTGSLGQDKRLKPQLKSAIFILSYNRKGNIRQKSSAENQNPQKFPATKVSCYTVATCCTMNSSDKDSKLQSVLTITL